MGSRYGSYENFGYYEDRHGQLEPKFSSGDQKFANGIKLTEKKT
jgi:hypothetical protein